MTWNPSARKQVNEEDKIDIIMRNIGRWMAKWVDKDVLTVLKEY